MMSQLINQNLPQQIHSWGPGRTIAAAVIAVVLYPIAQAINTIALPVLGIYALVSLCKQFCGSSSQWSAGHRFVILSSVPFVGAIFMSVMAACRLLS